MSKKSTSGGGIGCLTIIGIIFIVLKLLAVPPVAAWSWWLVLSPFLFQAGAIILILAIAGLVLWAKSR